MKALDTSKHFATKQLVRKSRYIEKHFTVLTSTHAPSEPLLKDVARYRNYGFKYDTQQHMFLNATQNKSSECVYKTVCSESQ